MNSSGKLFQQFREGFRAREELFSVSLLVFVVTNFKFLVSRVSKRVSVVFESVSRELNMAELESEVTLP